MMIINGLEMYNVLKAQKFLLRALRPMFVCYNVEKYFCVTSTVKSQHYVHSGKITTDPWGQHLELYYHNLTATHSLRQHMTLPSAH